MPAVKNSVYANFSDETREIVNGHVVKDTTLNTDYDIKDKQLETLLLRPTSKINLLERLSRAYREKKKSRKKKSH